MSFIKALLVFTFGFLLSQDVSAQNLVPNPSFEDYSLCPVASNQVDRCLDWENFGNSPDYWSTCGPAGSALPNNGFGYQYPRTGECLIGLANWVKPSVGPNYREFIGVQLITPTMVGQKYYFSFYCNNTYVFGVASNKLGIKLSTVPYDSCCAPALMNNAHLFTDSIITDTLSWVFVSGSFVADSVYNYLMIGNFFDDLNTDTTNLKQPPNNHSAYYFIDDICLTTDSIYNLTWTGIETTINPEIFIYPNPASEVLIISSSIKINQYFIIDNLGRYVQGKFNSENQFEINLHDFAEGCYFLNIRINNTWFKRKIIHTKL